MRKFLLASVAVICITNYAKADELIYLDSPTGIELLSGAHGTAGTGSMIRFHQVQRLQTYCSVASSINVLNSLGIESKVPTPDIYPFNSFNQHSFFTNEVMAIKKPIEVQMGNGHGDGVGVPLDQLGQMLNTFDKVVAIVYHASDKDISQSRKLISEAMSNPKKRIIINYFRKDLGQKGTGHFSPLGAYDEKSDRVLILDTASYKYPPVWATMADLHKSMNTIDDDVKASRGFIVVERDDTKISIPIAATPVQCEKNEPKPEESTEITWFIPWTWTWNWFWRMPTW